MTPTNMEEGNQLPGENLRPYSSQLEFIRKIVGWTESAINVFNDSILASDNPGIPKLFRMHCFNSFLAISLLDLLVVYKKLVSSETDWEKVFFIRQGYLIIYQTINNYTNHTQDILKLIYKKETILKNEYLNLSANLNKFKKDYSYQDNIEKVIDIKGNLRKNDFNTYYNAFISIKDGNETDIFLAFIVLLKQMENFSLEMEELSKKYTAEEQTIDITNTNPGEVRANFDKKLEALRLLIEKELQAT